MQRRARGDAMPGLPAHKTVSATQTDDDEDNGGEGEGDGDGGDEDGGGDAFISCHFIFVSGAA